jgi:hypothetical protein
MAGRNKFNKLLGARTGCPASQRVSDECIKGAWMEKWRASLRSPRLEHKIRVRDYSAFTAIKPRCDGRHLEAVGLGCNLQKRACDLRKLGCSKFAKTNSHQTTTVSSFQKFQNLQVAQGSSRENWI